MDIKCIGLFQYRPVELTLNFNIAVNKNCSMTIRVTLYILHQEAWIKHCKTNPLGPLIQNRRLAEAAVRGGCEGLMLENAVCSEEAKLQLESVAGIDLPIIISVEGAMRTLDRDFESVLIVTRFMVYI